jgi:membrane fusion protein, heavy metal efflux system
METEPVTLARQPGLLKRTQLAIVLVLAGLMAGGFYLASHLRPAPREETAEATQPLENGASFSPTSTQWAGFKIEPVRTLKFLPTEETDGKIALDDDLVTPVFSPYSGRVVRLFVRVGDTVHEGDPLLAVQANELVQAQNDLISAAATLRTARAQLALAETNERRQHALFQANGAAQKDWQQSQLDLAVAQGGLNTAQIALTAVRNRLRILGRNESEISMIETAPDLQKLEPVATVLAPIAGVVTQRQVGLGQNIVSAANGASTPQFQIGDLSRVWLVANVREESAAHIHLGDTVRVQVPAWPERVFQARVTYVSPSIDPASHRLPVRAEIDNRDGALKPEMLARFRIITGDADESPAVPVNALVYEADTTHVWVADTQQKTIAARTIRVGRIQDGNAQVLDGLKAGEAVATAGSLFLDRAVTGD